MTDSTANRDWFMYLCVYCKNWRLVVVVALLCFLPWRLTAQCLSDGFEPALESFNAFDSSWPRARLLLPAYPSFCRHPSNFGLHLVPGQAHYRLARKRSTRTGSRSLARSCAARAVTWHVLAPLVCHERLPCIFSVHSRLPRTPRVVALFMSQCSSATSLILARGMPRVCTCC